MSSSARRPLATPQEVADYLGVPVGTLYQWNHHKRGPKARRVGRHLRYRWEDVDAYVERREQGTVDDRATA